MKTVSLEAADSLPLRRAQALLEWNKKHLNRYAELRIEDLVDLFAPSFVVKANERSYEADHDSYLAFLNRFRADIEALDYHVQEYFQSGSAVVVPLAATITRIHGSQEMFDAIMLLKFDAEGKICHWQEVYSKRPPNDVSSTQVACVDDAGK